MERHNTPTEKEMAEQKKKMIKDLIIRNYQSHKATDLQLSPGVNAIVGQSDKGKSALLRALNWVVNNRPTGDSDIRSRWGGDTIVQVELDKGKKIERSKTKKDNIYSYDETTYKAVGTDIPGAIIQAFNMDEINIQRQHDAPYLISDTPGAVARALNAVANLDIIDTAMSGIAGKVRKVDGDYTASEQHLAELNHELEKYSDLEEREHRLKKVEVLSAQATKARDTEAGLQNLMVKLYNAQRGLKQFKGLEARIANIARLEGLNAEAETAQGRFSGLGTLLEGIRGAEGVIEAVRVPDRAELDRLYGLAVKKRDMDGTIANLRLGIQLIISCENVFDKAEREALRLEREYKKLMPDVCPLCGRGGKKCKQHIRLA